ncbi:MAG: DNA topoisomerase IB [Chloroflexota bacterium]
MTELTIQPSIDDAPVDITITTDPEESAREAGLRYVSDHQPGIRRVAAGPDFIYLGVDGQPLQNEAKLERLRALVIPPAWTNVWISPLKNGHIQATGRDEKGRKQYIYHPRWREIRDETKYHRMVLFGEKLPSIRRKVQEDLARRGLSRERVLASLVQLLDETYIRIGNQEYARESQHFGLTTMQHQHVDVTGETMHFHFMGKSGKEHAVDVRDRRVARMIKRLEELPGQELFQFVDHEGQRHNVQSDDVNEYLHEASGEEFSAKDFRTFHGTVCAAIALNELGPATTKAQTKRNISSAIKEAAKHLGNTPTVCRKSYVHPGILEAYQNKQLLPVFREDLPAHQGLTPDEVAVLTLLERRLMDERQSA